eukprot:comp6190_c0_seq1/m.2027 comp6190_c0_seq1/g.2027  ORF comp6190_c0_seq1/g.2027 comp6190_c0_seq1/m.2027 type:complete len:212 (-) comp6190_c0_seq1:112-747(-)
MVVDLLFVQPAEKMASTPVMRPSASNTALNRIGFEQAVLINQDDRDDHDDSDMLPRLSQRERFVAATNRFLLSRAYFRFSLLVILLSMATLTWSIINPYPDLVTFWVFESIIVSCISFEVSIRMMALGTRNYLRHCSNRLDLLLTVCCIFTLGLYAHGLLTHNRQQAALEEKVELAITIFRNGVQTLRLFQLLRNQRQRNVREVDLVRLIK